MSLSKILPLLIAAAPLALAMPEAAGATTPVLPAGPAEGVTTQLPRGAAPIHYAIEVAPDAAKLTFTGKVTISLYVSTPMPALVLNAADLSFADVSLKAQKGKAIKGTAKVDAGAQSVSLDFGKPVQPGYYTLTIAYAGIINTQANGL